MKKNTRLIVALFALIVAFTMAVGLSACNFLGSTDATDNTTGDGNGSGNQGAGNQNATVTYEVTYKNARVWRDSIGMTHLQTIFEVTNTGTADLYLSAGSYDLEDSTGRLVTTGTLVSVFPDVISNGEKAYYYDETLLDSDTTVDENTVLVVVPRAKVVKAKIPNTRFAVTDYELKDNDYLGVKATGRVQNTSAETQDWIYVVSVLYSAETPIGLIYTIIMDGVSAGQKVGFSATSMSLPRDITKDSVTSHKEYAYPLGFQF